MAVVLTSLDNTYYLNCFVLGQFTGDELPGKIIGGGYKFDNITLQELCSKIEECSNEYDIKCFNEAQKNLTQNNYVSYKLVPLFGDSNDDMMIRNIRTMIRDLYVDHYNTS